MLVYDNAISCSTLTGLWCFRECSANYLAAFETLEIQFTVSPVNGFTPNVIALGIEGTSGVITNPPIQFTSELFNGTTLLGTNVSNLIANTTFVGLDATAWGSVSETILQATEVDFSSILDDTIAGIIYTTVTTPITVFNSSNFVITLNSCTTGCTSPGGGVTIYLGRSDRSRAVYSLF